jgi:ceramide glucosyltransferase
VPLKLFEYAILFLGAIPFVYYFLAIFSSTRYFLQARKYSFQNRDFTPPISNLKPVRGLDPEAYENFASLCRQDYPEYELIFCATDQSDPCVPVIQKLMRDFPERKIRLLFSSGHTAINDKVAKLGLMLSEAQYEYLVFNDSDVRVEPGYLRKLIGPFRDKKVGGVTCFYVSTEDKNMVERLQTMGMISDFYAGILVAWQLDGVHFALGPTMVSTKERIRGFGGFQVLEGRPADDLLFGRLIAEQGVEVKLLPYAVETVPDFEGIGALFSKRVRWMTVMRKMRPWGHFGLLFTWGLPWTTLAVAVHPTLAVAAAYWGGYLACRVLITWLIGVFGLKQNTLWKKMPLIPVWDGMAFLVWLTSFAKKSIRWRGVDYQLESGTGHFVVPSAQGASHVSTRTE